MSHHPQYPPTDGGYAQTTAAGYPSTTSWSQGWLAFSDPGYLKGALLGAGLTYLLTNEKVQKALVKSVVTVWSSIQGGIEEVKKQIHDVKAEMSMKGDADKT